MSNFSDLSSIYDIDENFDDCPSRGLTAEEIDEGWTLYVEDEEDCEAEAEVREELAWLQDEEDGSTFGNRVEAWKEVGLSNEEKVRRFDREKPGQSAKQAAQALGIGVKMVTQARYREKQRVEEEGASNMNDNAYTKHDEAFLKIYHSHTLPKSTRNFLLNTFGRSGGMFACLVLCQDFADDYPRLSQAQLSACHEKAQDAIRRMQTPHSSLASKFLDDMKWFPGYEFHIQEFIPMKTTRVCDFIRFGRRDSTDLTNTFKEDSPLVSIFDGKPIKLVRDPSPSPLASIEEIRCRLNSQNLDYAGLVGRGRSLAMNRLLLGYDGLRFFSQANVLKKIEANPQPIYSAKPKSARLYTVGASLANSTRCIREAVFRDFVQFDIKHTQLSIVSSLWDSEPIQKHLQKGKLWERLKSDTGLDKEVVKQALYTLVFGGAMGAAVHYAMKEAGGVTLGQYKMREALLSSPLLRELEEAAREQASSIVRARSCIDAFGRELFPSLAQNEKISRTDLKSIIACQAQSYEIRIMNEVLKHLLDKGVDIWLFLHDGIILEPGSEGLFAECQEVAWRAGREFGMTIDLSCETVGRAKAA